MAATRTNTVTVTQEEQMTEMDKITNEEEEYGEEGDLPYFFHQVVAARSCMEKFYNKHKTELINTMYIVLLILYVCYFAYAMYYSFNKNIGLLVLTLLTVAIIVLRHTKVFIMNIVLRMINIIGSSMLKKIKTGLKWAVAVCTLVGLLVFIILEVRYQPTRLISGCGIFVFLIFSWIISKDRQKIKLNLVVSGLYIQLLFGLLIIRWDKGLASFEWLGNQFNTFLAYTDAGSKFVLGPDYLAHPLVFQSLPMVAFYGAVVVLLYYWHVLQAVTKAVGYVMEIAMGIGPVEAFIAAANIFLGPLTSILGIAQLMPQMTMSELHTVLTTSFATVTGGLFAIYASMGAATSHLIAASFMSAPAALVVSKILYPEIQRSTLAHVGNLEFPKAKESSAIEAFCEGASNGPGIMAGVITTIIGFVSCIFAINGFLTWMGNRVGIANLTMQMMFSYVFAPVALFMGIPTVDCLAVGNLLGTKIFAGSVIAYSDLGKLINNRQAGLEPFIQPCSELIATYAMCGLGTFVDVGITLSVMASIVPARIDDLRKLALRGMVAGNLACFITACLAGFLYGVE